MNIAQSQSDTSSSVPGRLGGSGLITFCCFFCKSLEMDHSIGRHKTIAPYDLVMQNNYAHPPVFHHKVTTRACSATKRI